MAAAAERSVLTVRVIEAKDLKAGDWKPYVKLAFEKQKVKTPAAESASAPQWNAEFKFDVTMSLDAAELRLEVADKQDTKEFLGHLKIRLDSLPAHREHDQWFKLVPKQWRDKVTGSIRLVVLLEPHASLAKRLSIADFDLMTVLGKGSFGKVMLVRKKDTSRIYAMKVLSKSAIIQREEVEHTRAEQRVLARVDHPFIVGLKFSFTSPTKLYLVLDYIAGGELFFHLQNEVRFSAERVRFYVAELSLALGYLHGLDIVYRDLKPENILLANDGHVCITDFGLCKEELSEGSSTTTFCGTAEYLAPEVLRGEGYGKAIDWWSLGILCFEMLTGLPPFYNENTNLMYKKVLYSEVEYPADMPGPTRDLIAGLLRRDPATRLGSGPDGVEAVKREPYFAELDFARLVEKQIEPPWRPQVESEIDHSNFSSDFTDLAAVDSLAEESVLTDSMQRQFTNFTYTQGGALIAE